MVKRLFIQTRTCWLIAVAAAGVLGMASAQDTDEAGKKLTTIAAGSDYLQTGPGTEAALPIGGKMMKVALKGVPIQGSTGPAYGNTDTIIERTQDAVFPTNDSLPDISVTINITLTALNLSGTVPGPNGGACTVNITLAPSPASTGTLTLTKTSNTGGTYTSVVTVEFMETFTPVAPNTTCYPPVLNAPPCKLVQKGGTWSTTPLAGEYEMVGPYGDLQANVHTNLPPGYGDFYISSLQSDTAATAKHVTCEALASVGTACPTGKAVR